MVSTKKVLPNVRELKSPSPASSFESNEDYVKASISDEQNVQKVDFDFPEGASEYFNKLMSHYTAEMQRHITTCMQEFRDKGTMDGFIAKHNPKFSECVEQWLDKKSLDIRPNTLLSYKANAYSSIIPALGGIFVKDLTRAKVQDYFADLKKRGISANTMNKHKVIIRGALENALFDGIVDTNVADRIKLPKKRKYEGHALTEPEVSRLLTVLNKEKEPIRAAVTLALVYGLRRSEICGLRWQDVDFVTGVIRIRNTYTEYSGRQFEAEATKSSASRRDLCMIGDTASYLLDLRDWQLRCGFKADKVCLHENGKAVKPEYLTRAVKTFLVKCGYEGVRLHDLRHTAASLLARRLPVKQVQVFLGHEDVGTTLNIYTHIADADKIMTAQTMDGVLSDLANYGKDVEHK